MRILYVLCGGKGKRLGSITRKVPKPLVRINGRPFLSYIIDSYSGHFDRIALLAGYKGEKFLELRSNRVDVLIEDAPLGTAGALIAMKQKLPASFFLCNGDTFLCPFEIDDFIAECEKEKRSALVLCRGESRARGSVETKGGKITEFLEKRGHGSGKVYSGLCFLRAKDIPGRTGNGGASLERDVFPALAAKGELGAYECGCTIYDIGTPAGIRKFKGLLKQSGGQ